MPAPQDQLLQSIVTCLPATDICLVEDDTKRALANCLRQHYRMYPEAINLQAKGNVIPSTVNNHR
jgi:coproporphyrinogen III oxidase